jgi:hypothetical protein
MRRKGRYVFAVAGEAHVRQAEAAIAFLKRATRRDILLVLAHSDYRPEHDEIINAFTPPDMTDRQAAIFLKTGLADILGDVETYCYLDSDVIAVSPDVDEIFSQLRGPIAFAADHARIDMFSRYAVRCFCTASPCAHLRDRLDYDFSVRVRNPDWTMWNGGVFVCGPESGAFMQSWHEMVLKIFKNPFWHIRDQGALAAAAWQLGLQDLPVLDARFNLIVDRFNGVPEDQRGDLPPERFAVRADYKLGADLSNTPPAFLHFINGGAGQTGWRNWDEAAAHHLGSAAQ